MTTLSPPLPARRSDLRTSPQGTGGRFIVKVPDTGAYLELGREEKFLLDQLDGNCHSDDICRRFQAEFDDEISQQDVDDLVALFRGHRLLETPTTTIDAEGKKQADALPQPRAAKRRQSLFYWRKRLVNPDRLFSWLEPRIRFCWTWQFLAISALSIIAAAFVMWQHKHELGRTLAGGMNWQTAALAWFSLFVVITLHEFAHGLTCKRYGGEVRDIGFLLMFFMPCFYCNVSDAWLFPEKSKRLWVTFAGAYCQIVIWSLAVFVWRVALPGSTVHTMAFIVISLCGVQTLFNLNPLIKLDGYYLLSDAVEIPNLQQRAKAYLMAQLRRLLWGGPPPPAEAKGWILLSYGLLSWIYVLLILSVILGMFYHWFEHWLGVLALPLTGWLVWKSARGLLGGLFKEEFMAMFKNRRLRAICWGLLVCALVPVSFFISWSDRADGEFQVRAKSHVELRAPVAGFLKTVHFDEGQALTNQCIVAELSIPDLESRIAQTEAARQEAQANLRLLQAGPRFEEISQQEKRIEVAQVMRDVAQRNLDSQQQVLKQELQRFEKLLAQLEAESEFAQQVLERQEQLKKKAAISEYDYLGSKKEYLVACAKYDQIEAEMQARISQGTLAAQIELSEREKELAHEQSALALLKAGARPEEIEAAEATVARLAEEVAFLEQQRKLLTICSPIAGVITTSRLKEQAGNYFKEGDLICEVEDAQSLEIVIEVDEDQAARVRAGQQVQLKARSLPFELFKVRVERVAPKAEKEEQGDAQSQVNVYCRLEDPQGLLRSGMTGHARIDCGHGSVASIFAANCLRLIRTEFWW